MHTTAYRTPAGRNQLFALLQPQGQTPAIGAALLTGVLLSILMARSGLPAWAGPALTLALLAPPLLLKWRADQQEFGTPAMLLSILLIAQGLHTVEHAAQWVQYHLLGWPARAAGGLISPLNSELIHFSWNVMVLLLVIYLLAAGMRNPWMWLLLIWASAHTAEHIYLFIRFLEAVQQLRMAGLPLDAAQGLPGILGRDGWLATSSASSAGAQFICTIAPGLSSAPRLDIHFWWNAGEIVLLLAAAAHGGLPFTGSPPAQAPPAAGAAPGRA